MALPRRRRCPLLTFTRSIQISRASRSSRELSSRRHSPPPCIHPRPMPPGSPAGSPSPPIDADNKNNAAPPLDRRPSKERTLQMLAANESDRLVMHAGHTPNHSLSFLPTAESSGSPQRRVATDPPRRLYAEEGSHPDDSGPGSGDEPLSTHESRSEGKAPATSEATAATGEVPTTTDSEQKMHEWDRGAYPPDPPADDFALKEPLMVATCRPTTRSSSAASPTSSRGSAGAKDAIPRRSGARFWMAAAAGIGHHHAAWGGFDGGGDGGGSSADRKRRCRRRRCC